MRLHMNRRPGILAQEDKDRYLREKRDFLTANPLTIIGNRTKKNHVHKPRSSYTIFMSERFRHVKDISPYLETGEIVSKVAKEWRSLTQQQKAVYKQEADEEKLSKRMELQKRAVKDLASTAQASQRMSPCEEAEEERQLCKIAKKVKTDTKQCIKNQRESTYSHQFLSEDSLYSPTEDSREPLQSSETSYQYELYSQVRPISEPESFSYTKSNQLNLKEIELEPCWEHELTSKLSYKEEIYNFFDNDVDQYSPKPIFDSDFFGSFNDDLEYFS